MRSWGAARRRRDGTGDEGGFGLIEVLAATVIMVVIVVALGNLLVDSLAAGLLAKQRDEAADLAGDVVENAKALGATNLSATTASSSCTTVTSTTDPVPILTGGSSGDFQHCFLVTVDTTRYEVVPLVTTPSDAPDTVTVTVTWDGHSYLTTSDVGAAP